MIQSQFSVSYAMLCAYFNMFIACDQISSAFPRGQHLFFRRISYVITDVITYALSLPVLLSRKWRAKCVTDENRGRVEMPVTRLCYGCLNNAKRRILSPDKGTKDALQSRGFCYELTYTLAFETHE